MASGDTAPLPGGLRAHLEQQFAAALAGRQQVRKPRAADSGGAAASSSRDTAAHGGSSDAAAAAAAIAAELGRLAATTGPPPLPPLPLPPPLKLRPAADAADAGFISSQLLSAGRAVGGDEPNGLKALCAPGGAFEKRQTAAALRKVEQIAAGTGGRSVLWIAEEAGRDGGEPVRVGSVGVMEGSAESAAEFELPEGQQLCGLTSLYLADGWRGKGVGRALLRTALGWAKAAGYGAVELAVWRRLGAYTGAGMRVLLSCGVVGVCLSCHAATQSSLLIRAAPHRGGPRALSGGGVPGCLADVHAGGPGGGRHHALPLRSVRRVRKMSSWPRSWANFSLFWRYRNAWGNLHLLGQYNLTPFSLSYSAEALAKAVTAGRKAAAEWARRKGGQLAGQARRDRQLAAALLAAAAEPAPRLRRLLVETLAAAVQRKAAGAAVCEQHNRLRSALAKQPAGAPAARGGGATGGEVAAVWGAAVADQGALKAYAVSMEAMATQVRKAPSWLRSSANFSLSQLCSHRNGWANLHILGRSNTFLATALDQGRGREWRPHRVVHRDAAPAPATAGVPPAAANGWHRATGQTAARGNANAARGRGGGGGGGGAEAA
jgi:GNAT superfamily N-acetyltransferase